MDALARAGPTFGAQRASDLAGRLGDENPAVRAAAVEALRALGGERSSKAKEEGLQDSPNVVYR